jgi:tetratricopeptide (TPR) repeat protein
MALMLFSVILLLNLSFANISDDSWQKLEKYYILSKTVTRDPSVHYHLAMVYAYTGFLEEGFKELAIIPSLDPQFPEKILKRYLRKSKRSSATWETYFYLAFAHYVNDQKEQAILGFTTAAEMVEEPSIKGWIYGYKAYVLGEKKRWSNALETIEEAVKLEPDGAGLFFAYSVAKKETGDKLGAAVLLIKAAGLQAKQLHLKNKLKRRFNET